MIKEENDSKGLDICVNREGKNQLTVGIVLALVVLIYNLMNDYYLKKAYLSKLDYRLNQNNLLCYCSKMDCTKTGVSE
jgi:hypothetical protein